MNSRKLPPRRLARSTRPKGMVELMMAGPQQRRSRGRPSNLERWVLAGPRAAAGTRSVLTSLWAAAAGSREGCSDRLTTAMVVQERSEQVGKDGADRRHVLRVFLESNVSISSRLGFNLHPEYDSSTKLCPPAAGLRPAQGLWCWVHLQPTR